MTTKLVQKQFFRVRQEFEIIDDYVNVLIKTPFQDDEAIKVMLTVLNPEPVIKNSRLEFNSRVNGEALISLLLEKPNTTIFNDFVATLKSLALEEFNSFAGLKSAEKVANLAGNAYQEPPEFDTQKTSDLSNIKKNSDHKKIGYAIKMLEEQLDSNEIGDFLSALEELKTDPQNELCLRNVINAFNASGSKQGAILTYAPYISVLLTDDHLVGR